MSDAIRGQRYSLKRALNDRVREAMQRGYDNRLQETLVVRWLAGHANAERHDLLVEATAAVEEERWSRAPLYFDACLALGTRASLGQCVATFERIEDLRKELERERGRGAKLTKRRAPRDWDLSNDDWSVLRDAVVEDHDRVVDRWIDALDCYRLAAEQHLAAFAARLDVDVPELRGDRPYASWKQWWKASRDALPETLAADASGDDPDR